MEGVVNLDKTAASSEFSPEKLRENTLSNIRKLQNTFTRELLAFALFIIISIGALNDFAFLANLSEPLAAKFGPPPPTNLISAFLILYIFSAIILILSRMMSGSGKCGALSHLAYLTGFYGFYHFADALMENFWAVFASGLTILTLESYHIWIYCSEEIVKEKEVLAALERKLG